MMRDLAIRASCKTIVAACIGLMTCTAPAKTEKQPASSTKPAPLSNWTRAASPPHAPLKLVPGTYLIEGATILTGLPGSSSDPGPRIENGNVLLQDGRIQRVTSARIDPPPGAIRIDASGKFVTPGLIDTHSHLGVYPVPSVRPHSDGNEATGPVTADVRAEDAIWPQDPGFQKALMGGVTTLQILPGSANVIGGTTVTLKLHPSRTSRAMHFPGAPRGLKMACGENPKRVYGSKGRRPSTRMGLHAVWRKAFVKAKEYETKQKAFQRKLAKWQSAGKPDEDKKPTPPPRDFVSETLLGAMAGDILIHVHCYRADEMIRVLELGREFDFRVRSFHHAVEAYKIRDVLARESVSVSTWADWWGFKMEAYDAVPENLSLLGESKVLGILHSDSPLDIQRLNQEAAKAYYAGRHAGIAIDEAEAMRWITANAAWALGIEDETGTLEAGKMADVVVWSRHPFSVYSKAEAVFVDGVLEYRRTRNQGERPGRGWSDFEARPASK